jgi:hypothetical protein
MDTSTATAADSSSDDDSADDMTKYRREIITPELQ